MRMLNLKILNLQGFRAFSFFFLLSLKNRHLRVKMVRKAIFVYVLVSARTVNFLPSS